MNRNALSLWMMVLASIVAPLCAVAQERAAGADSTASSIQSSAAEPDIEVTADDLEYQQDKKLMIGRGNVVVTQGKDVLKADYVTVQTDTQDAYAKGNVFFTRQGTSWKGDELHYNFKTETGDFGEFTGFVSPFFIQAKDAKRVSSDIILMHNAIITTCEGDKPEFYIKAREAKIVNQQKVKARGVVYYLGGIPIFYSPYFSAAVGGDGLDFDVVPGYSDRQGAFLLTACNYMVAKTVKGSTHLDYRSERGFGYGQDFRWWSVTNQAARGILTGYYADDDMPIDFDNPKEDIREGFVDSERYRLKLSDNRPITDRDTFNNEWNYLSDPFILEDFFDDEYRDNVQPENRATLSHRGDQYQASLKINQKLNDFYSNVNRTPEAALTFSPQPIADSPVYYQGNNTAGHLEKSYADFMDEENYDAMRLDSGHLVYYPTKNFGFLNFIPRTSYRATYYSDTLQTETNTSILSSADSNGVSVVTTNQETVLTPTGSELRNVFGLGFQTSFKAFKVLSDGPTGLERDEGLRHVAEPYADYTYVPEPNLLPQDLPQFDDVDKLNKQNSVKLGMRNKIQTKRAGGVHDLIDLDIYSNYRFEKPDDQEDFSDIFFDGELRLVDWFKLDFDAQYDSYEGIAKTFNLQAAFLASDESNVSIEYRHEEDIKDLLSGGVSLFPNRQFSLEMYSRYEFNEGKLEEISALVSRKTRCMGYGFGWKQIDEENTYWVQIWILSFPDSVIELGR